MTEWLSVHRSIIQPTSQSPVHQSVHLSIHPPCYVLSGYRKLTVCPPCAKFFTTSLLSPPASSSSPPPPSSSLSSSPQFYHLNEQSTLTLCQALHQFHHTCSLCVSSLQPYGIDCWISYVRDKKTKALRGEVNDKGNTAGELGAVP